MKLRVSNTTLHPQSIEVQVDALDDDGNQLSTQTFMFGPDDSLEECATMMQRSFESQLRNMERLRALLEVFHTGQEFPLITQADADKILGLSQPA